MSDDYQICFYYIYLGHKFIRLEEIKKSLDSGTISGYIKDETIIRARGLPWQVSDVDVADFFVGLNISR